MVTAAPRSFKSVLLFAIPVLVVLFLVVAKYNVSLLRNPTSRSTSPQPSGSEKLLIPSELPMVNVQHSGSTAVNSALITRARASRNTPFVSSQLTVCPDDIIHNFTKKFVYLIETESCIPKDLLSPNVMGDPAVCNCDVVVLGYKEECKGKYSPHIKHILLQNSTWTTGRECLYKYTVDSGKKYMYYLFMDDDTRPEVYRGNKSRSGWRTLESFLVRYRPPIAVCDTESWHYVNTVLSMRKTRGCGLKGVEENVPAMYWDAMFNIFHYEATKSVLEPIFPFWNKFDKCSWFYSNWYVCVMGDVVYHLSNVYNSEVIGRNHLHRPYPRSRWSMKIVTQIFADIQSIIPEEFKKKGEAILELWRTSDLDKRRKNYYNYCVDQPKACVQPFQYTLQ